MVMGDLCVHAFSSSEYSEFDGYDGVRLARVWPPEHAFVDTRLLPSVTDEVVLSLHEAFARSLRPHPNL
jgi:hypothetical protein